ncbi:DEKNAAC104873 [Brettanomyces naardenensis]|uniref:DEKNAAC104873 n=1 Tax=Brettanomyces naardenensis TaxID=13370 RepID=A0A448YS24_BRENA|nr:DEKNAAC104873 [Brettanomyces naardenensis]
MIGPETILDFIWLILSIPSTINSVLTHTSTTSEKERSDAQNLVTSPGLAKYRAVNIPNYFAGELEDSIDLQIKSLLYDYRRLRINALTPFLKPSNSQSGNLQFDYITSTYTRVLPNDDFICNKKLDSIYNIERFKEEILNDPYRVLIDYPKNKLRAMLILSDSPSEVGELPELNSDQYFKFLILRPDDSDAQYINVLVNKSGMYHEHHASDKLKTRILRRVINRQRELVGNNFNKDDRANIIRSYLQKLALHIQVERIYRATLKRKQREMKENLTRFSRGKSIQSYRALKLQKSRTLLNSNNTNNIIGFAEESSPKKVMMARSTEDLENMYISDTNSDTHLRNSDSESQASSSGSSSSFSQYFSPEEKNLFYEQSKMAVRIRIERERLYLV